MQPLELPDSLHLLAAQGWLELGSHLEANEELDEIEATDRAHPDVLELRWQIYAKEEKWDACLDIATALTRLEPQRRFGWLAAGKTLHKLKRTGEARTLLVSVYHKLEPNPVLPYALAIYCAQLGYLHEAKTWLQSALLNAASGDDKRNIRIRALDDADLRLLWEKIGEL